MPIELDGILFDDFNKLYFHLQEKYKNYGSTPYEYFTHAWIKGDITREDMKNAKEYFGMEKWGGW